MLNYQADKCKPNVYLILSAGTETVNKLTTKQTAINIIPIT